LPPTLFVLSSTTTEEYPLFLRLYAMWTPAGPAPTTHICSCRPGPTTLGCLLGGGGDTSRAATNNSNLLDSPIILGLLASKIVILDSSYQIAAAAATGSHYF
jgi:hypothetical protein